MLFEGVCPVCETNVTFKAYDQTYRSLQCSSCKSQSRNRALWRALNKAFPQWRRLAVHESSPGWDRVSQRLVSECERYTASQFEAELTLGEWVDNTKLPCKGYYVQDLQRQTFNDEMFDLVITQDVFEHIPDPYAAVADIARTLRPGGATIMSVPVVRGFASSRRRARFSDERVEHLLPPEYHGNPVSGEGSLVTVDWGYDIASRLSAASGLWFVMQTFENMDFGIRDECNQILIGFKRPIDPL